MIGEITNHLWQSTVFAFAVALMALAFQKNRAEVRYRLWLSASLKFLVPFSLLASAGTHLWEKLAAGSYSTSIASTAVSHAVAQITQPFSGTFVAGSSIRYEYTTNWMLLAALIVWLSGFLAGVVMRLRSWFRVRAALRASQPLHIAARIPIRSSPGALEPGVVGFLRQVVLLPDGISERLTPAQLAAVLAHEQAHMRRRDNLTAAIHMVVEAVFWFHPMVWWIGSKLVDERERACDEVVLSLGNEPTVYAEGILNVCKSYLELPLRCVSGATGSDLKTRIRSILSGCVANDLSVGRKAVLVVATASIFAAPILMGAITASTVSGHSLAVSIPQDVNAGKFDKFVAEVVSIKRSNLHSNVDSWGMPPGSDTFSARNVTFLRILREAYALGHGTEDNRVIGGPEWLNSDRFDIDAKVAPSVADAIQKLPKDERMKAIQHILFAILMDRCKLAVHRETRTLPVYMLVIGKSGSKLKEASPDELVPPTAPDGDPRQGQGVWMEGRSGPLVGKAITMTDLANMLQYLLNRTTVDKTGLTGKYTFRLRWEQDENASNEDAEASFLRAFPDQLGLKLESGKGPVEVIVVDHFERPSEN